MYRVPAIVTLLFGLSRFCAAQFSMVTPIEGEAGVDYRIINYVDWGLDSTIQDHHCLSKTYDGHQGTDFVLSSFRTMDEGVNVLAVDSGVVIFAHDGEFDREKQSVISKGLGNYIGITHEGDFQTYYGHLKKNSLMVSDGDTVEAGQVIAQVASSGNSSDPHLHFELWYDSTYYIDPYQGPCGNNITYWQNADAFDSTFSVWHSSMWNGFPTLDTLREYPEFIDRFYPEDTFITYWSLMHGVRAGDSLSVEWYTTFDDSLQFQFDVVVEHDQWYYYFWTYILRPIDLEGTWLTVFYRNDEPIDSIPFSIEEGFSVGAEPTHNIRTFYMADKVLIESSSIRRVQIFDALGRKEHDFKYSSQNIIVPHTFPPGVYFVIIEYEDRSTHHTSIAIPQR